MIKVAIMGFGTVGSGVYEIIRNNEAGLERKSGHKIDIKYILDIRDFDDHPEKNLFTKSFDDILNDDEVKVVIEVMGGLNPAYDFSKKALLAGKSVITSNKELVATHGTELLKIAEEKNCNYLFEASVGGGIPILRPLNQCMAANNVEAVYGILNGTTNYILTKMFKEGAAFSEALAQAQELGYAERNPEADVEGHDACRKIAILASLASGKFVDYKNVATEGITAITKNDVAFASKINSVIKLVGYAKFDSEGKVYARVCPMVISKEHQMSDVSDVFNAVMVHGDFVDDVMFYGRGAGKLPTASAVVADVVDAVKHLERRVMIKWEVPSENIMLDPMEIPTKYMVRTTNPMLVNGFIGASMIGNGKGENGTEYAFITGLVTENQLKEKIGATDSFIRMLPEA
ncbi:MAG: homoserine dehydrogenase [Clostridia bacterium]|nr:homoserine dehydrogenase [Clostridia bacterium]